MKITENIINALNTSRKAVPSEGFIFRMEQVALAYSAKVSTFSRQTLIGIAASFVLLVTVNIYAVDKYNDLKSSIQQASSEESYNLVPTNSIYNEQN